MFDRGHRCAGGVGKGSAAFGRLDRFPAGRDQVIGPVEIGALEPDAVIGLSGMNDGAYGCTGMEANTDEADRRSNRRLHHANPTGRTLPAPSCPIPFFG
jgi:hypothetical protein